VGHTRDGDDILAHSTNGYMFRKLWEACSSSVRIGLELFFLSESGWVLFTFVFESVARIVIYWQLYSNSCGILPHVPILASCGSIPMELGDA